MSTRQSRHNIARVIKSDEVYSRKLEYLSDFSIVKDVISKRALFTFVINVSDLVAYDLSQCIIVQKRKCLPMLAHDLHNWSGKIILNKINLPCL